MFRAKLIGDPDWRGAADFEEASMAVSAHVITMGLENGINGNIKAWFKQFNFLPPFRSPRGKSTLYYCTMHRSSICWS